jgi:hypothetical protein
MFGNFVSNDSLTMLMGTLLFASVVRYLEKQGMGRLIAMSAILGMSLLTKGTFLLVGPALAMIVLVIETRRSSIGRALAVTALFCLIFATLGCYKYVENAVHFGQPFVNNLDTTDPDVLAQRGTYKGFKTLYDIDITKLIRRPILQVHNTFSYPLLLYGTFWYAHIPESSFLANIWGYAWVGSLIYSFAIVPTLIFLIGVGQSFVALARFARAAVDRRSAIVAASLLMLLSNLAIVIAAGVRYDVWTCFQSRLCFPSMFSAMVLFGCGAELLPVRARWLRFAIYALCWATVACCLLYFAVEIPFARGWLPRGAAVKP